MKRGYTITELLTVLSTIAILISAALPAYNGLHKTALASKTEKEIQTLKAAVENYYSETQKLPSNIGRELLEMPNPVIDQLIKDPFNQENLFQYETGKTATGKKYYLIYSKGIDGEINFFLEKNFIKNTGDDIIVSNLPIFGRIKIANLLKYFPSSFKILLNTKQKGSNAMQTKYCAQPSKWNSIQLF